MRVRSIAVLLTLAGLVATGDPRAAEPTPPSAPPPPVVRAPDPATMSAYGLGLIRRGPTWNAQPRARQDSLLTAHRNVMRELRARGLLLGAGTVVGDPRWYGVLLFKDVPQDSLGALLRADPVFRTATLLVELHRWLAPRGIGEAWAERARLRPDAPDSLLLVPMVLQMKPAFLPPMDSGTRLDLTAKHQGYLLDLMLDGRLLAAGPPFDDGDLRGVGFFGTDTATARRLTNDDAAVQAGRLDVVMLAVRMPWGVMPPHPSVREAAR